MVEQFSAQVHIFSYRHCDYENLFKGLQTKLNSLGSPNELFEKSFRQSKNRPMGASLMHDLTEFQFKYFRNEFSMKMLLHQAQNKKSIIVNLTPDLLLCLQQVNEYIDNYYIAQDLKQYRPQRRPIGKSQLKNFNKSVLKSVSFKRKRRNIVRDWLYFIVWYVRLKRILDQHKASSNHTSIFSLLGCHGGVGQAKSQLKSPIQDPTQMTTLNLSMGLPLIQVRLFENNKKMKDFYHIIMNHQTRMNQGPRTQNTMVQRIAPLSLNIQNALISQSVNHLTQDYSRDIQVRGVDLYLTKIEDRSHTDFMYNDTQDWNSSVVKGRISKNAGDKTLRTAFGTNQESLMQVEPQILTRGASRGQGHQNQMFKAHKMSTQQLKINPIINQEYSDPWNHWGEHEDIDMNNPTMIIEHHHQQQEQSIWSSLFNAFKNLFSMKSDVDPQSYQNQKPPSRHDPLRSSSNVRNSIYRGYTNSMQKEVHQDSGFKSRHSILQNAQLELTLVNRNDKTPASNVSNNISERNVINQAYDFPAM